MKLLLKDLGPGDEFEYVNTARHYRKGKFVVLNSVGSYLEPSARESCIFIFSFTTNKVCQHWRLLDVTLISKAEENNMENTMGHFINWQFGVPVKIFLHGHLVKGYSRLTHESDVSFRVVNNGGDGMYCPKSEGYTYERIPYQQDGDGPVYPVCQARYNTTYLDDKRKQFGGITNSRIKPTSVATLNIDGKTIELSAETTAELKNKLGI